MIIYININTYVSACPYISCMYTYMYITYMLVKFKFKFYFYNNVF